MADDALLPIRTAPIGEALGPFLDRLAWSKADLGRFLGVSRQSVSRWAHGHVRMSERDKAALLFVQEAARTEREEGNLLLFSDFGDWALPLGIRGLICARFEEQVPEGAGRVLGPDQIFEIRKQLGWIQAEMAAFFGVTHSTPAKWEGPDPQVGPATEAELIALREWASRPDAEEKKIRTLWQEGISRFMTEIVSWEPGTFPD